MVKEYTEIMLIYSNKQAFLAILIADSTEIIDFKSWWPLYFKKTMFSAESAGRSIPKDGRVTLQPSKFMHFSHASISPGVVVVKDYVYGLLTRTFHIRNTWKEMIALPATTAYPDVKRPILKQKMEDLRKLSIYLPQDVNVQQFYQEIFHWSTCDKDVPDVA
ncbi:hypothetical protein PR048_029805 [Dryococelus australis]|uniref:Uncharacterized protein n=1 Tax=Dryococelus australis TaxID=614101 RepID=A0ABQ9GB38_9NEOP|nr:hypothetical protein PR048_029805 [Dryococelus australis]